jgi:hypothetical protein
MRIDPAQSAALSALAARQPRKGVDKPAFEVDLGHAAKDTRSTAGSAGVSGLDTLLGLQMVGQVDERQARRKRGVKRGQIILGALDDLKIALLDGRMPLERLARVAASVSERERDSDDPRLEAILDEIELRARVELAKLGG